MFTPITCPTHGLDARSETPRAIIRAVRGFAEDRTGRLSRTSGPLVQRWTTSWKPGCNHASLLIMHAALTGKQTNQTNNDTAVEAVGCANRGLLKRPRLPGGDKRIKQGNVKKRHKRSIGLSRCPMFQASHHIGTRTPRTVSLHSHEPKIRMYTTLTSCTSRQ